MRLCCCGNALEMRARGAGCRAAGQISQRRYFKLGRRMLPVKITGVAIWRRETFRWALSAASQASAEGAQVGFEVLKFSP